MALTQFDVATRNAMLDAIETTVGTAPTLYLLDGTMPADCATADAGNVLATGTLPSDWAAAASSGSKAIAGGPWTLTGQSAAGTGTQAKYYRLKSSGGTVRQQGPVGHTNGTTQAGTWSANSTAVTLSGSNAAIVKGMGVSGAGIPTGTYAAAISGTSLTLSTNALAAGSGVTLTFTADVTMNNTSVANGQTVSVSTFTTAAGNA